MKKLKMMEQAAELHNIRTKMLNLLIILSISFTKLDWDTKNEYFIIFQLRELNYFLKKFDFYSYFYISLFLLIGNSILLLNLYKFNLKFNNIGILLSLIAIIWFFSLGFGTPYVKYYYYLVLSTLYLIYFYFTIKYPPSSTKCSKLT